MVISLFQIDKSGSEVFDKDYSIALIKDKQIIYGVNVPQHVKDQLIHLFNTHQLGIGSGNLKRDRLRFKIRSHKALIILLLLKAIKDAGYAEEVNIEICNDIDGHFHEIKDMIFKHLSKLIPALSPEDIVQAKFQKPSLIDTVAKNLHDRNKEKTKDYNILKIDLEELIKLVKK